jgi:hypothetical protein
MFDRRVQIRRGPDEEPDRANKPYVDNVNFVILRMAKPATGTLTMCSIFRTFNSAADRRAICYSLSG